MASRTLPRTELGVDYRASACDASVHVHSNARPRSHIWLLASMLFLVAIFLSYRISTAGELGQLSEDEAHHAVTGLYFADLLTDLPISHPLDYTYRYYARYPALGLGHWPPFFHICEGLMFLVGGRSATTARITVLVFALLGLSYWFLLVRDLLNVWASAFSVLALGLLPFTVTYEQAVMLEVPALALCLAATFYWIRFLDSHSRTAVGAFLTFAALALLTKQQSLYLLPFCTLTVLGDPQWKRQCLMYAGLFFGVTACCYVLLFHSDLATIWREVVPAHGYGLSDLLFGIRLLPFQLGWPMLTLSAIGAITCCGWGQPRSHKLMLLWILSCYFTFSFLNAKEVRYFFNWIPPLLYFASWPLAISWYKARSYVGAAVLLAGALACSWVGRRQHYPYLSGYSRMVRQIVQINGNREILLFDGQGDGNFIFNMRVSDPGRRFVVLTKGLYVTRIMQQLGAVELVHDREGLQRLFADYGIRHIVVTDQTYVTFPIQRTLRELLKSPQFTLLAKIPVSTDAPDPLVHNLLLYENREATRPRAKSLKLKMLTLPHDIDVPLQDLGIY